MTSLPTNKQKIDKTLLHGFVKQAMSHNKYLEEKEMWEKRSRIYNISKRVKKGHGERSESEESDRKKKYRGIHFLNA